MSSVWILGVTLAVALAAPVYIVHSITSAPMYPSASSASSTVRLFQVYVNQVNAHADAFLASFYGGSYEAIEVTALVVMPIGFVLRRGRIAAGLVTFLSGLWFFSFFTSFDLLEGTLEKQSPGAMYWIVALDSHLQWVMGERALLALGVAAAGVFVSTMSLRKTVTISAFLSVAFECILWAKEPGVMAVHATNLPELAFVTNYFALGASFLLLVAASGWRNAVALIWETR